MKTRVYLAWQVISDGRPQVRRWSPDRPNAFLGYQRRNSTALHWLRRNGDPRWPDCLDLKADPFEVIDMETGEVTRPEVPHGSAA